MKKMDALGLRANWAKVIKELIASGEPVHVTIDGEPMGKLIPGTPDEVGPSPEIRNQKKRKTRRSENHAGSPKIFASVPPKTSFRADSGTPFASNIALYCNNTCSAPAGFVSVPKTILVNALGFFSGVSVPSSVLDHQKNSENLSSRPLSFVSVDPLKSKNT